MRHGVWKLATGALASAALLSLLVLISPAQADQPQRPCNASADLVKLPYPLQRVAHRIAAGETITIVALGSSSTAGAGASSPAASYPSRLAVELAAQWPRQPIKVINRGVNGEEAKDMLARFEDSVSTERPDLVLWQVGTNAILRDQSADQTTALLDDGLKRIKALGADVVLIDPQFAPKVIDKTVDAEAMVDALGTLAKKQHVDLFRRFVLMKQWHVTEGLPFDTFVSPDGLHMNDWGYACFAKSLGGAIAEATMRPVATVSATSAVR